MHKRTRTVPTPDWRVCLPDHHEAYITEEDFNNNRQQLARNQTNGHGTVLSGAAREGLALLQGLLICGSCGRALTVRYTGSGGTYPMYECNWEYREGLADKGFYVRTKPLDDAVCQEVFKALKPAELELALAALGELEERDQAIMRQWQMRIERAEYECALAERRYAEVDCSNRLVAASLEHRWNEALERLEETRMQALMHQNQKARAVTPEQKTKILALARDLPRVWHAPTTEAKDRKRMLRLLIRDITVENVAAACQVILHIRWQGGASSDIAVTWPTLAAERLRYPPEIIDRVRELLHNLSDLQVAQALNAEGLRSIHGRPFTKSVVNWIRCRYSLPAAHLKRPDEITVKQLADEIGVDIHIVHYWIRQGIINARQTHGYGPWWIKSTDEQKDALRERIPDSGHFKNRRPQDSTARSAL